MREYELFLKLLADRQFLLQCAEHVRNVGRVFQQTTKRRINMSAKQKYTVNFTKCEADSIRRKAKAEGITSAEVLRSLVDEYVMGITTLMRA
jgi:hypothetical protein